MPSTAARLEVMRDGVQALDAALSEHLSASGLRRRDFNRANVVPDVITGQGDEVCVEAQGVTWRYFVRYESLAALKQRDLSPGASWVTYTCRDRDGIYRFVVKEAGCVHIGRWNEASPGEWRGEITKGGKRPPRDTPLDTSMKWEWNRADYLGISRRVTGAGRVRYVVLTWRITTERTASDTEGFPRGYYLYNELTPVRYADEEEASQHETITPSTGQRHADAFKPYRRLG